MSDDPDIALARDCDDRQSTSRVAHCHIQGEFALDPQRDSYDMMQGIDRG